MENYRMEPLISLNVDVSDSIVVILDTNVILDYLEKRNREVRDFTKKLIRLSRRRVISLGTTLYNIAEVLDKELEIKFQLELLKNRLSSDEIIRKIRKIRNRNNFSKNLDLLNAKSKRKLFGSVLRNIERLIRDFVIFYLDEFNSEDYEILEDLIINE